MIIIEEAAYKIIKRAKALMVGYSPDINVFQSYWNIPIPNRNLIVRVLSFSNDTIKEFNVCSAEQSFEYLPLALSQERINFILDEIDAMCDAKEKRLKELSEFPLDTPF